MADIHFFTDIDLLNDQTSTQAFGALNNTQYRITNLFTASVNPFAYAVCDGQVLVQKNSLTNLYNIILKPNNAYDFKRVPILYFIYRGIADFNIDGTKINNRIKKNGNNVDYSGIGYTSNAASESNIREDNETLISLFNRTFEGNYKLIDVKQGDKLGIFSKNEVEFQIVLGSVDFEPKIEFVRNGVEAKELDVEKVYDFTTKTLISQTNKLYKRRRREEILNYMDIAAFYGMYIQDSIKVTKNNGNKDTFNTQDEIYINVISKFWNKNTIYFDIRDERGFSYNYHRNSTTANIRCSNEYHESYTDSFFTDDTYDISFPTWPILIFKSENFTQNAPFYPIRFSFKLNGTQEIHVYSVNSNTFYDKKRHYRIPKNLLSHSKKIDTLYLNYSEDLYSREIIFASPLIENSGKHTIASYYKILFTT